MPAREPKTPLPLGEGGRGREGEGEGGKMERGRGGRGGELDVFVSEEAVALPLQQSVQDHRREQLPYISDLKTISLVEIIIMI